MGVDLTRPDGFTRSYDGYRRDAFYRFNQSLQHFLDSSARLETTFGFQEGHTPTARLTAGLRNLM